MTTFSRAVSLLGEIKDNKETYSENELCNVLLTLAKDGHVPDYIRDEDIPYSHEDFVGTAENSEKILQCMQRLLEEMAVAKSKGCHYWSNNNLKDIIIECFLCAIQYHNENCVWSSKKCRSAVEDILTNICTLCGTNSILQLLVGNIINHNKSSIDYSEHNTDVEKLLFSQGILNRVLQILSHNFNKKTWKKYPALMYSYYWILSTLKAPHLCDHLGYLLPPALFVLDDWEQKNKLFAFQCIKHILSNTAGSELRWYGRAQVIYDALKPLTYSREADVLCVLHPIILQAVIIIEADPENSNTISTSKFDIVLDEVLSEMSHEQRIILRSVYVEALCPIVAAMGITVVRWSTDLLNVCSDYLVTNDGSEAHDRLHILKVLQEFIRRCWPQIHFHVETILKMIFRFVYDITLDECPISSKIVTKLLEECQAVIVLLREAAPNLTTRLSHGIDDIDIHHKGACAYTSLMKSAQVQ